MICSHSMLAAHQAVTQMQAGRSDNSTLKQALPVLVCSMPAAALLARLPA